MKRKREPRVGDMAYRILCSTCHYGKGFGAGQIAASRAGTRHVQIKPHHTVALIRETTIGVIRGTDGVVPLTLDMVE